MKLQDIEHVLRKFGSTDFNRSGDHVMTNCIFAPFYESHHKSNFDRNPSAGVRIQEGISSYNCFSCKEKGGFLEVVRKVGKEAISQGKMTHEELEEITSYIILKEEDSMITGVTINGLGMEEQKKIPKDLIDSLGNWHDYASDRGITEEEFEEYELGYCRKATIKRRERMVNRLLFPVKDIDGKLIFIQGRSLNNDSKQKYMNYPEMQEKGGVLYGEHLIEKGTTETLLIVEGVIDVIKANRYLKAVGLFPGVVAVSPAGSSVTGKQQERIKMFAKEAILGFDKDNAGEIGERKTGDALKRSMIVSVIDYKEAGDMDEFIQTYEPEVFLDILTSRELFTRKLLKREFQLRR